MKQTTRLALVAAMLTTVPAVSMAATGGKITFNGKVTDQTCEVVIDGSAGDATVTLPTVVESQLSSPGAVAGRTPFVVKLTHCKKGIDTAVNVTLTNPELTGNGTLKNTYTSTTGSAAGKVALQLLPNMTGANPFDLTSQSHLSGLVLGPDAEDTMHEFAVQYISHEGGATAGHVQAVVNYDITYP